MNHKSYKTLTRQIRRAGLSFPISFVLTDPKQNQPFWTAIPKENTEAILLFEIGKLQKTDPQAARSCPEMNELLRLYQTKLRGMYYRQATTIPAQDRKMIAYEGFVEAVLAYPEMENLYDFWDFVAPYVRSYVRRSISHYQASYTEGRSLDAATLQNTDETFSLYDFIPDRTQLSIPEILIRKERMAGLTPAEKRLLAFVEERTSDQQIMDQLQLSEANYKKMLVVLCAKFLA